MIEEPGSFSGSLSSPRPQRGPLPQHTDVAGDLVDRDGGGADGAREFDHRVMGGQRLEFIRGGDEGEAGDLGHPSGDGFAPALGRIQPVPTAVPPWASS